MSSNQGRSCAVQVQAKWVQLARVNYIPDSLFASTQSWRFHAMICSIDKYLEDLQAKFSQISLGKKLMWGLY